jgi:hypothetical protein
MIGAEVAEVASTYSGDVAKLSGTDTNLFTEIYEGGLK